MLGNVSTHFIDEAFSTDLAGAVLFGASVHEMFIRDK